MCAAGPRAAGGVLRSQARARKLPGPGAQNPPRRPSGIASAPSIRRRSALVRHLRTDGDGTPGWLSAQRPPGSATPCLRASLPASGGFSRARRTRAILRSTRRTRLNFRPGWRCRLVVPARARLARSARAPGEGVSVLDPFAGPRWQTRSRNVTRGLLNGQQEIPRIREEGHVPDDVPADVPLYLDADCFTGEMYVRIDPQRQRCPGG
jgi:hypothetical protein